MIRQALELESGWTRAFSAPREETVLVIDGVSTQWYLDVLRMAMRRRLVRFLSILSLLLAGSPALGQVGTCVTPTGDSLAPWTDGTDPACGADCAPSVDGCTLESDACGQALQESGSFQLNQARAHFKLATPETVDTIDGPANEAPSCRSGAPLCGSGTPHTPSVVGTVVLVLPTFSEIIPQYRGGLLPKAAAWANIQPLTDHHEPPSAPPPRELGA